MSTNGQVVQPLNADEPATPNSAAMLLAVLAAVHQSKMRKSKR